MQMRDAAAFAGLALGLVLSPPGAGAADSPVYRHVVPSASGPSGAAQGPGESGNDGPSGPVEPAADEAALDLAAATVREGSPVSGTFTSSIPGATWSKASGPDWLTVSPDGALGGASGDIDAA